MIRRWLPATWLAALALPGCLPYRTYPLFNVQAPTVKAPLEPTGVALLPDGRLVMVAEGDAHALLVPNPDRPVRAGGVLDLLPLHDGRDDCAPDDELCPRRHYRAGVELTEQPIRWLPDPRPPRTRREPSTGRPLEPSLLPTLIASAERRVTLPYNVEDLAPFGPDRVLGITEYSTVGRKTGYRKDYTARSRRQTERLFVLERDGAGGWNEVAVPEIERLRELLSDWGRGECGDDMLVEGLAYDPAGPSVYVGLRRCDGPSLRVLRYDLGAARAGRAASIESYADGLTGATPGPTEGISGLTFAEGRLWALTAWDSFGYESEAAFGGRLHLVEGGHLHPEALPGPFLDRPSALALLPGEAGDDTLVLFDNDAAARAPSRPSATVIRAPAARPEGERFAELLEVARDPLDLPLGLNGFDVRWYNRDHRLSQLATVLAQKADGTAGAWTRALGGLWQIRVGGSLGQVTTALPFLGRRIGHNRQAAALTDYHGSGLTFTSYRARITVVPRDRERQNPSVAALMSQVRPSYRVTAPLGAPASASAGLVLQGFEIDTTSRADRGICLAGMELGVDWAPSVSAEHTAVTLQSTLIGGLCNDFDTRGEGLRHGRTTDVDGGVDIILHFAVVEGAEATRWSAAVYDRDRPGPRIGGAEAPQSYAKDPDLALKDLASLAHVHCASLDPTGRPTWLPQDPAAPPPSWRNLGSSWSPPDRPTAPVRGASLRGFALALDPSGFDPETADVPMTEAEALNRNNYIHRYLVRAFALDGGPTGGGSTFLEGGLTHGIHRGLLQDNQRASALYTRVDLTGFAFTGNTTPAALDFVYPKRSEDPNLLPEDGFIRWADTQPLPPRPTCAASW